MSEYILYTDTVHFKGNASHKPIVYTINIEQ